jgi:hypothetical protein
MRSPVRLARLAVRGASRGTHAIAVLACVVSTFTGCSPSLSVRTGWDPRAEFAKYRTWMWKADGSVEDLGLERQSRSVIAEELSRHGLEEVSEEERADLWCIVHARISSRMRLAGESEWGYDMGPYGGGWGYDDTVEHDVPVGTMVIDLVDRGRKEVVWRARANDVIRADRSNEQRDQTLAAVIQQMFAGYPPAPGSVPESSTAAK